MRLPEASASGALGRSRQGPTGPAHRTHGLDVHRSFWAKGSLMPGYRSLPDSVGGDTAERTRAGALLEQEGNHEGALCEYELALTAALAEDPVVPGFLCGRLATLYRKLERYDDEVTLLEAYQASQVSEKSRARFDARLSKARAIAAKQSKRDSVALASIRDIKRRSAIRRGRAPKDDVGDDGK